MSSESEALAGRWMVWPKRQTQKGDHLLQGSGRRSTSWPRLLLAQREARWSSWQSSSGGVWRPGEGGEECGRQQVAGRPAGRTSHPMESPEAWQGGGPLVAGGQRDLQQHHARRTTSWPVKWSSLEPSPSGTATGKFAGRVHHLLASSGRFSRSRSIEIRRPTRPDGLNQSSRSAVGRGAGLCSLLTLHNFASREDTHTCCSSS